jgi:hypothetical protein
METVQGWVKSNAYTERGNDSYWTQVFRATFSVFAWASCFLDEVLRVIKFVMINQN